MSGRPTTQPRPSLAARPCRSQVSRHFWSTLVRLSSTSFTRRGLLLPNQVLHRRHNRRLQRHRAVMTNSNSEMLQARTPRTHHVRIAYHLHRQPQSRALPRNARVHPRHVRTGIATRQMREQHRLLGTRLNHQWTDIVRHNDHTTCPRESRPQPAARTLKMMLYLSIQDTRIHR